MNEVIERLKSQIDELSIEDKAKLIEEVLRGSGLQVVMGGGNFISAEIVLQIQNGSAEQLGEIFKALSYRVSNSSRIPC